MTKIDPEKVNPADFFWWEQSHEYGPEVWEYGNPDNIGPYGPRDFKGGQAGLDRLIERMESHRKKELRARGRCELCGGNAEFGRFVDDRDGDAMWVCAAPPCH
jgi:hypothetical protein